MTVLNRNNEGAVIWLALIDVGAVVEALPRGVKVSF